MWENIVAIGNDYLPVFGIKIDPYAIGECIMFWLMVELSEKPPELVESNSPLCKDDDTPSPSIL